MASDRDYAAEIRDIAERSAQVETEQLREWAAEIERLRERLNKQREANVEKMAQRNAEKQRAERAESALAACESRAAGLAAALTDARSRCLPGPIQRVCDQALAASGLECVPGWWQAYDPRVTGRNHSIGIVWSERDPERSKKPCTVVYHKEQQHGA